MIPAHIEHVFKALDDNRPPRNLRTYPSVPQADESPTCTDTARKSYMTSQGQEHAPHAGLGSVEAGPIVRYWTVRYEARGRSYYDHVIACDPWKATMVVMKQRPYAACSQVVREIQRDEYEHLTRSSP